MDANNFNILWTEASWVGNKTLTPHYPNQRNCLYLKWTHSKTHKFILLKEKWNNTSISDQNKKKNMPWSYMESLLSCHKLGWLSGPQWNLEGHRVAVRRVVRLHRNREKRKKQVFLIFVNMGWCVWIWEVSKHGLNLCSSILFGGGRKVKERRKKVKTDLWLSG